MRTGDSPGPAGLLGRALAVAIGVALAVTAFLVGALLLAVFLGIAAMVVAAVAIRLWWLRRQPAPSGRGDRSRQRVIIEGEYRRRDGNGGNDADPPG